MKRIIRVTIIVFAALSAMALSVMAEGTLSSPGEGLIDYYIGMTKSRAAAVAPAFEIYGEMDNVYAIDALQIGSDEGLSMILALTFEEDIVNAVLMIGLLPDSVSNLSGSEYFTQLFALSYSPYLGTSFDWKRDCEFDDDGDYICSNRKHSCMFSIQNTFTLAGCY